MKYFFLSMFLIAGIAPGAWAQATCASDGQVVPLSLTERFISADCEACWRTAPTQAGPELTLSIDWIVPSANGDLAPLSAAASRDALDRLQALKLEAPKPSQTTVAHSPIKGTAKTTMRVAHGVALGGYMGASIELTTDVKAVSHWQTWLLLVETIPAGVEGTPVARHLVRNALLPVWPASDVQDATGQSVFREMRPMGIPFGTTPEQLRVVGLVHDGNGTLITAVQSACKSEN